MKPIRLGQLTLVFVLAVNAGILAVPAAAETSLKMILNWKFEGPQGMIFLAQDRGYFKQEGLDVTFDQGNGSAAAVPMVANGAYDVGFGDINALIELAAKQPEKAPVAVYMLYNRPPFTVAVLADGPIKSPTDFPGHKLGGTPNDGALKLFPALCSLNHIDCTKVAMESMQPALREQMLVRGQVDGVFGYVTTIRFSAKRMGVDPDKQLRFIRYDGYGLNLYSNAIIVSKTLAKDHPEAVKGLLNAINHGIKDAIADPDAAIKAVVAREPLLKPAVERERLEATFAGEMSSPEIATIGLGDVDDRRLSEAINILVKAEALPRTPTDGEVFDRSFLPPKGDRPTSVH
ncbi:ABC transporter substrate-binding protein [Beijerinckia sp. L45]|uniref:ABC transporter substrate-binding protein n=1 Tax=Beijerinckia sp. L45 TaxID=1641855 RepID=UPI00131AD303|nr:ABC transporter substrate-binding protein [Beijerinckia sp. L45]